ncbi:MAG TPA: fibronectin type III domain-containing protein, partial [Nitrospiria bacterium]|nr:fibronectin type III domain-containing protein [Nitrospiria bacterium]
LLTALYLIGMLFLPRTGTAEWAMDFTVFLADPAAEEGRTLTQMKAGASPLATDLFDNSLDVVAFPGGSIQAFFSHAGEEGYPGSLQALWRDVRSEDLPQRWEIRIISSQSFEPLTFSWSNPPFLPSDFCYAGAVALIDKTSGRTMDLAGPGSLTFYSTGTATVPEIRSYTFLAENRAVHAPGTPTGLTSSSKKTQIILDWDNHTDPALAGYHVWRSSVSGFGLERVTSSPLLKNHYRDRDVRDGETYFYAVTALSENGCESGFSNETVSTPGGPGGG